MLIINETTKTHKSKDISIFTDGSTFNNQSKDKSKARAGVGVFFGDNDKRNMSKKLKTKKVTNQVAELMAIYYAINKALTTTDVYEKTIHIYSDSMYSINCITTWSKSWEKNNWKKSDGTKIENKKIIKKLYYLYNNLDIKFTHVKAHKKEPSKDSEKYFKWYGNNKADYLAVSGAKS